MKSLVELLSENPSAKAEHDTLVREAEAKGKSDAKEELKARIDKVKPILSSDEYDQPVKELGILAMIGEKSMESFETIVTMRDMDIEAQKQKAAEGETDETPETPASGGGDAAKAEADYQARKARLEGV
jgi:hypothetical protein